MQDAEEIRRFTRGFTTVKDPPFLPIALWVALVPLAQELGYLSSRAATLTFALAFVATIMGARWFKRSFGVVTLEPRMPSAAVSAAVVLATVALETASTASGLPVRLGLLVFAVFLASGGRLNGGLRRHLYVLAIIVGLVALLPEVLGARFTVVFMTSFGLGWVYVCVQDYRILRRSLG
jgi:hypothetical protein